MNTQKQMSLIPLSETDVYVLFREYEEVFLYDKDHDLELWRVSFYGDPRIGFLGLVNDWAIVGGDRLLIWKNDQLKFIEDPDLVWIHAIRQVEDDEVEILTDPWGEHPAIWKFHILSEEKIKVRNFDEYREKAYTDEVEW